MKIYVAIVEHRHGNNIGSFLTKEDRTQWEFEYVKDNWEVEHLGEMPEDQDEAMDAYWENQRDAGQPEILTYEEFEVEKKIYILTDGSIDESPSPSVYDNEEDARKAVESSAGDADFREMEEGEDIESYYQEFYDWFYDGNNPDPDGFNFAFDLTVHTL